MSSHQENVVFLDSVWLLTALGALHSELPEDRAALKLDSPEPYSAESSRDQGFLLMEIVGSSQRALLAFEKPAGPQSARLSGAGTAGLHRVRQGREGCGECCGGGAGQPGPFLQSEMATLVSLGRSQS